MTENIFILIVWLHFFADFICQNDKMALNKSKSLKWLTIHAFCYSLFFVFFGPIFWIITFLTHWIIDFFTSRLNKKLWEKNKRHWFFVGIGFDQAIHFTVLTLTYVLIQNI